MLYNWHNKLLANLEFGKYQYMKSSLDQDNKYISITPGNFVSPLCDPLIPPFPHAWEPRVCFLSVCIRVSWRHF